MELSACVPTTDMPSRRLELISRAIRRLPARWSLKRQLSALTQVERTYFVVLMPASLHIAELAMKKIERECRVVLVSNGLSDEENEWIRENLPDYPLLISQVPLHHHQVLNTLLRVWRLDFGIMDYDCFVMDGSLIHQMSSPEENQLAAATFMFRNDSLGIVTPETFLIYFQINNMKRIMRKYKVDSRLYRWDKINDQAKAALAEMGVNESNMFEPHKDYIDTLKLIFLLGVRDGLHFEFVARHQDGRGDPASVYHIGSVAKPHVTSDTYSYRGSYFWRQALEHSGDETLRAVAISRFDPGTSLDLEREYSEFHDALGDDYFAFTNELFS